MTTVFSIKNFDPSFKEDYILLIADSRGIFKGMKFEVIKKIHLNKRDNFMFAYAGTTIHSLFSKSRTYYKSMMNLPVKEENLMRNISHLNNLGFKNDYLFVRNSLGNLLLCAKCEGEDSLIVGNSLAIGSGAKFIQDAIEQNADSDHLKWRNDFYPLYDLIPFCFKVLQEVSKNDEGTGGYMSFGVMTKKGSFVWDNFEYLKYCFSTKQIRDKIKNKKIRGRNIEEILF